MSGLSHKSKTGKKAERGFAMLVVLTTIALVGTVVSDFQFNARVDLQLAYNSRDELQAEYNALGALKLRAMLLRKSRALQSAIDGLMGALGADPSMKIPIAQMLDMIPIECSILSTVLRTVNSDFDEETEGETQDFFPGECIATSQSEHSKISIKMLGKGAVGRDAKQVTNLLMVYFSNKAMERHFEEDDLNGTHADDPAELIGAIADWLDRDKNQTGNQVSDEDRFYDYLDDSYDVKNAPFDSLAELQLVHGVDDEIYALIKDHVSIYTDGVQIELASASTQGLIFGLMACAYEGFDPENMPLEAFAAFETAISEMTGGGMGMGMGMLNVKILQALVISSGLDTIIDPKALPEVFTDKSQTTWFTLDAYGQVGNVSRSYHAVLQTIEGQYYHVRID
ncbi:general secretion pathway protein GspK [Myxococcota bacterium]|nr:general secretion pathway protein GspK [Myxococcota bacterium]